MDEDLINENYDKEIHEYENAWRKYTNCRECGAPLRPPRETRETYPGTRARYGHVLPGYCKPCVHKDPAKYADQRVERPRPTLYKKCVYCDRRTKPLTDQDEHALKRVIDDPVTCSTCARKLVRGEQLATAQERRDAAAEEREMLFRDRIDQLKTELLEPFTPPRDYWYEQAACTGEWPDFDENTHCKAQSAAKRYRKELEICASCPVRRDCFMAAREEEQRHVSMMWTIRGGWSGGERRHATKELAKEGVTFETHGC